MHKCGIIGIYMSNSILHQIVLSDNNFLEIDLPSSIKTVDYFIDDKTSHKIWHDSLIKDFLSKEYSPEVLDAYNSLKPYAYKADLARYCILYICGGWYMDINNRLVSELPKTDTIDLIMFYDIPGIAENAIQNSFFYAKPNSKVLKKAIDICVDNIKNKYYGKTWHYPTGPAVLGKSLSENGIESSYVIGSFIPNDEDSFNFTMPNGDVIAKYKNKHLGGQVGISGSNNYAQLWNSKEVYSN